MTIEFMLSPNPDCITSITEIALQDNTRKIRQNTLPAAARETKTKYHLDTPDVLRKRGRAVEGQKLKDGKLRVRNELINPLI
ncbi:hypothetical protein [Pseudaestuariivita rosea]|uniref:hypothetical protein n=1 Tax=Pseudaestuariivita rosea TaxID=2763263 RepID=UPI001ABA91FF|nr:hypothetical protein [Pseudaestuariivita rosea]